MGNVCDPMGNILTVVTTNTAGNAAMTAVFLHKDLASAESINNLLYK
jgi:hypothetical protein